MPTNKNTLRWPSRRLLMALSLLKNPKLQLSLSSQLCGSHNHSISSLLWLTHDCRRRLYTAVVLRRMVWILFYSDCDFTSLMPPAAICTLPLIFWRFSKRRNRLFIFTVPSIPSSGIPLFYSRQSPISHLIHSTANWDVVVWPVSPYTAAPPENVLAVLLSTHLNSRRSLQSDYFKVCSCGDHRGMYFTIIYATYHNLNIIH